MAQRTWEVEANQDSLAEGLVAVGISPAQVVYLDAVRHVPSITNAVLVARKLM